MEDDPEPIERLEEIVAHPADKTFNALHDRELATKRELAQERHELAVLLTKFAGVPPKKGSRDYEAYVENQKEMQVLKEKISKKHDELMEILKNEEKISKEFQEKKL